MTQFRFYSTGLNSNNILFNIFAFNFDNYLNEFTVENEFVPLGETLFIPYTDDAGNYFNSTYSVDYCRVKTGTETYYLFVDNIEPSITNNGWTIYFTIDIWNTYKIINLISQNRLNIKGQLQQGHVNDFIADENDSTIAHPTLIYTNDIMEAPLMKDGLVFNRNVEKYITFAEDPAAYEYAYLYCLVNAGKEGSKTLIDTQFFLNHSFEKNVLRNNMYRVVVFGINITTGTILNIRYVDLGGTTYYKINGMPITDLSVVAGQSGNTNLGIVSMYISVIPPNNTTTLKYDVNRAYAELDVGIFVDKAYTDTGLYFGDGVSGVIPQILRMYEIFEMPDDLYYITSTVNKSNIGSNSALTFEEYYNNYIVKSHTNVYNKYFLFVDNSTVEIETFETQTRDIYVQIEPTLNYVTIDTEQTFKKGYSSKRYLELYSTFEPIYNNSYWQRRNAEMSTLSAQFAVANSAVGTILGGVSSGVNISESKKHLGSSIVSGITGLAKGISSIVENSYNLEYVSEKNNAIIADGIANSPQTSLGSYYSANSGISAVTITLTDYCKEQVNNYLHIYGYSSDILITESFFIEHMRKTFNYIKCSNVIVSGASGLICNYIETLLLSGVTFWHALDSNNHINYASNNVQVNI